METKSDIRRLRKISKVVGFPNLEEVEAKRSAGGITLMWSAKVSIKCKVKSERLFCCDVDDGMGNVVWSLLACHSTLYLVEKPELWKMIEELVDQQNLAWMIVGDLNEVISDKEK